MLAQLQQHMTSIYGTESAPDVRDFLITDAVLANALSQDRLLSDSEESLLLAEGEGELSLSLYLDGQMLERLESDNPLVNLRAEQLDDLWKVVEGVSHFNCVAWKASRDRSLSLLELELQAEIDKFVTTLSLALQQADTELARRLHRLLFEQVAFHADLDDEQLERYRYANQLAARYCHRLAPGLNSTAGPELAELRHFYRLQSADKIRHIERLH